ncbi:MAG: LEA type 2 family protein [Bacteroidales bacterium]|nr:LEA type 2 family protein [Bacteroidales bacterium]
MKRFNINIIFVSFALIVLITSCNIYKTVDVGDVNDVKFRGMAGNKLSLDLKVPISNPNNFKLKIKSLDFDISVNDRFIGKMKNDTLIIVPKHFDGVQDFPVYVQLDNLLTNAMMFYKLKKEKQVEIKVEGEIIVKSFLHNKKIKVSEKQVVDIGEKLKKINL